MNEYLDLKYTDYEKSFQIFKSLLTTDCELDAYPPSVAENQTFGKEFPGALIRKPNYKNCIFVESNFNSSDALLSRFHNCSFNDCMFNNCDLRYCDIFSTIFQSHNRKAMFSSCNLSFGNLINSNFINVHFSGCSFRQMQFENSFFDNCTMKYCSIEQSIIKNCVFKNLDLRKTGVRYCVFEDVTFDSVVFHILDLAKNFGLVQQLMKSKAPVYVAYENEKVMPLNTALVYIQNLTPYYLETRQFYELINVYAIIGDYKKIIDILPLAFENAVSTSDFASLQDLCSLIVKFKICTTKQLRDFYSLINQLIIPDKFPHYLRKNYNLYIENIKHILVDNPYDNPSAQIILNTNINSLSDSDMAGLLMAIETNIKELSPEVDAVIQLRHHSPYDVIIELCGALPEILIICQIFYYCLGGTKSFSDLKKSRKEKIKKSKPNFYDKRDEQSVRRIEFSMGKFFSFKYEKEYKKRIESLEYTIK